MTTTPNPTATTDAPSRAFSIIREVLATPTTATADTIGDKTAARIEQRLKAAGLLVDAPTEEQIEAVARELACLDEGDPWPTNAQLGGSLTGDRDMEYRSGMREQARDLLLVAARAAGVAPQEPSGGIHEPDENRVYCVRCGGSWPCQPAPSPDREKLIAEAKSRMKGAIHMPGRVFLSGVINALAAQPVLDPEKVAEELRKHKLIHVSVSRESAFCVCDSSVRAGTKANLEWFEEHRSRALCEAAKRGELT